MGMEILSVSKEERGEEMVSERIADGRAGWY